MSLNKLPDYVAGRVLTLLSSINVTKYKLDRPASGTPAQFIVVNAFSISSGRMQKFVLNVNYHAKNLSGGVADNLKLQNNSQSILNLLEEYEGTDMFIEFESSETFSEPQFDEHYSNLRFTLKFINNS